MYWAFRAALAGLAAGIAGTISMQLAERLIPEPAGQPQGDPPPVLLANKIATSVFHHPLAEHEKAGASQLLQFSTGSAFGVAYSLLVTPFAPVPLSLGLAFGVAIWIVGDEVGSPLLGVTPWPNRVPLWRQAKGFTTHVVFGIVTELVRAAL